MPLTAEQVQSLVILEVGETDSQALVTNKDAAWASYADKAAISPRLQELYFKRRCIDLAIGEISRAVTFTTPTLTVYQKEAVANLQAMRTATQSEIDLVEKRSRSNSAPVFGTLSTVGPVAPPTGLPAGGPPDGNDLTYSGTIYRGVRWQP